MYKKNAFARLTANTVIPAGELLLLLDGNMTDIRIGEYYAKWGVFIVAMEHTAINIEADSGRITHLASAPVPRNASELDVTLAFVMMGQSVVM